MGRLAVSVMSIPEAYPFREGLHAAAAFAYKHEVGLQLLPMRGYEGSVLLELALLQVPIVAIETDWYDNFVRKLFRHGDLPILASPFLFGGREKSRKRFQNLATSFPHALLVDGPGNDPKRDVIEVSPRLDRPTMRACDYISHPGRGVVFDTCHAREDRRLIPNAYRMLTRLIKNERLALFHLQTRNKRELVSFLKGNAGFLKGCLRKACESDVDIVIEISPFTVRRNPDILVRTIDHVRKCMH